MSNSLRAWKHVALLAALVAVALLEPLALDVSERVAIGVGVATLLVYVVVLLAVFENRWEQRMAPAIVGDTHPLTVIIL